MEDIKRLLLEEKAELLSDIREKTAKNYAMQREIGDAIDSSVEEQDRELGLLLQDRERTKIERIDEALKRMDSEDYGFCDECGEDISRKRLMAMPLARMCVKCQSNEERTRLSPNAFSRADSGHTLQEE